MIRLTDGQKINAPIIATRPSSVRARKALFDMLIHRLQIDFSQYATLDIFAGAGSLGFEAMLRGSPQAAFIDRNRLACNTIRHNATKLGMLDQTYILCSTLSQIGKRPASLPAFGFVLADPPYRARLAEASITRLIKGNWLEPKAWIILEMAKGSPPPSIAELATIAQHDAAGARFTIFQRR